MSKKVFFALAGVGLVAAAGPASATGAAMRTVRIALTPEDAAVAVDGHPRQHPNGLLELKGPLGAVFTVEAVANGVSAIERVAVTDVGALPARLVVPAPPIVAIFEDGSSPGPIMGALTIVCVPKCDHVREDGSDLSQVVDRSMVAGPHTFLLSAPNGVKRTLVVEVLPAQTRAVRIVMDAATASGGSVTIDPPAPSPTAPGDMRDAGYLTLASYPWAKVSEEGRALCVTPCIKVPLSPGLHVLALENEGAALQQQFVSVTVRTGETVVKRLAFR